MPGPRRLSAAEQAGSLLIVGFESPGLTPETNALLDDVRPLGTILFARNTPDKGHVLDLLAALRARDPEGLIAVDHEGGRVDRMPEGFTRTPAALKLASVGDPGLVRDLGRMHARELRAAGFDIDFAPVLDVHTNPDNPVIGDRAFGTTPEEVIHNSLPYLQGLTEGGILGCGKHFPGHGDTATDTHFGRAVLSAATHPIDRLRRLELRPFARAIAQGIPMIMTSHVVVEAIDPNQPATLSSRVITDLLRTELRYQGFVPTDDMEMKAATGDLPMGEAVVRSILAGCDVALVCRHAELVVEAHTALTRAIEEGTISAARLAQTERRRTKLLARARKMRKQETQAQTIGCDDHRRLAEHVASLAQRVESLQT